MSGDGSIGLLRWSSLLMNNLRMWWWCCKELMRDELLPCDALPNQLMSDHKLNQTVMIEAPILLCWALLCIKGTILSMFWNMKIGMFIIRTRVKCIIRRIWYEYICENLPSQVKKSMISLIMGENPLLKNLKGNTPVKCLMNAGLMKGSN